MKFRHMVTVVGVLLLPSMLDAFALAPADTITTATQEGTVRIESNVYGAKVYLGDTFLGHTPCEMTNLAVGTYHVRIVHPDENSWYHPPVQDSFIVHPGEHPERLIMLSTIYTISSTPADAEVRLRDSVLGRTPLLYSSASSTTELKLRKDGYEEEPLTLPKSGGPVHAVLRPQPNVPQPGLSALFTNEQSKNLAPVYYTLGGTVVSGVAAAYFKIKADSYHSDYRATGDQGALDRVRRYDTISGIALVATELGVVLLSYLLLSH